MWKVNRDLRDKGSVSCFLPALDLPHSAWNRGFGTNTTPKRGREEKKAVNSEAQKTPYDCSGENQQPV
jgi:hypothetical protein